MPRVVRILAMPVSLPTDENSQDADFREQSADDVNSLNDISGVADIEVSPLDPEEGLAAGAVPSLLGRVSGTGLATGREIWRLAIPIMMSQVLVTAVGVIDIAMVGRLGAKQVAAVGYATQLSFMSQSALFAVGFACVALMARAIGAGDRARARASLGASLAVAF